MCWQWGFLMCLQCQRLCRNLILLWEEKRKEPSSWRTARRKSWRYQSSWIIQSVSQSVVDSVRQAIWQSVSDLVSQSVNRLFSESVNCLANRSVSQSVIAEKAPPPFIFFNYIFACQSEERAQFEILKAQMFAERAAKRERRPKRARAMPEEEESSKGQKSDQSSKQPETVVGDLVNHCPVSPVSVQQPNRKHLKVARSRLLTKSWPTLAGKHWRTTEQGEYDWLIHWLTALLSDWLAVSSGLLSQTESVLVWTGCALVVLGESIRLSCRVSHIGSEQNEDCLSSAPQVQKEEVSEGANSIVDVVVHFYLIVHV